MKAFFFAIVAMVVITIGSNRVLNVIGFSAADTTVSTGNVRLSDSND